MCLCMFSRAQGGASVQDLTNVSYRSLQGQNVHVACHQVESLISI